MKWLVMAVLIGVAPYVSANSWQDLWATKDQQAKTMMDNGEFDKAKDTFLRDDWRAASAYRAKAYKQAATLYQSFKNEDAYYNQGNALAYLGKYEQAISAYNKALAINPNNQDAIDNRKLLQELLKKNKQDQKKQDKDKQNQSKQDQDQKNQDEQNQDKQDQDKQDQNKQDQDKQDKNKQDQDKQDQNKQDQDKQDQNKQDQVKKDQDKKDQDKPDQPATAANQSQEDREKQQAREQWLRLIPDDPGGLMREKFLRDHLRRQRGWNQ